VRVEANRVGDDIGRTAGNQHPRRGRTHMRERDERPSRIEYDDAGKVPARGRQTSVPHLALDRAEIAAFRLEEHTRAIGFVAKHRGLAVRQSIRRLEQFGCVGIRLEPEVAPRNRRLQRAI
jgi:hypothetical protein